MIVTEQSSELETCSAPIPAEPDADDGKDIAALLVSTLDLETWAKGTTAKVELSSETAADSRRFTDKVEREASELANAEWAKFEGQMAARSDRQEVERLSAQDAQAAEREAALVAEQREAQARRDAAANAGNWELGDAETENALKLDFRIRHVQTTRAALAQRRAEADQRYQSARSYLAGDARRDVIASGEVHRRQVAAEAAKALTPLLLNLAVQQRLVSLLSGRYARAAAASASADLNVG